MSTVNKIILRRVSYLLATFLVVDVSFFFLFKHTPEWLLVSIAGDLLTCFLSWAIAYEVTQELEDATFPS